MSENFQKAVDGMKSVRAEECDEDRAGHRDGSGRENSAVSVRSFLMRLRGVEKALHARGKILIHAR